LKTNYQLKLDEIIKNLEGTPRLLLHSCCGPCSSYVLTYLSDYFKITVLYYNPNIAPYEEYNKRLKEQIRLINELKPKNKIDLMECDYDNDEFMKIAKGLENEVEGGARCTKCYYLRLEYTALKAKENNYDYFGTTLSVSPYKNAEKLNKIGSLLEDKYGVKYLFSDFKKRNGYKESIRLSREYKLYRQNYCGCIFSKNSINS
jgi:predicted adenine nucleotide alpha hydrolase (AANH) superfamily ATPase